MPNPTDKKGVRVTWILKPCLPCSVSGYCYTINTAFKGGKNLHIYSSEMPTFKGLVVESLEEKNNPEPTDVTEYGQYVQF